MSRWEGYPAYRAGNYSGGFEAMFRHHLIAAPARAQVNPLQATPVAVNYRWGFGRRSVQDYLDQWPVSGLLIARQGRVWSDHYRFGRDATMRLTSWSMAKSVTSLLVGIALDQGLIRSLDDLPQDYVPELQGTLHGQIPLRHLLNMSSGTDVNRVVREWRSKLEAPGVRYNYNELCPLTMAGGATGRDGRPADRQQSLADRLRQPWPARRPGALRHHASGHGLQKLLLAPAPRRRLADDEWPPRPARAH
jgi:CubicO group peptidase (beta-lactamase class C family)